MQVQNRMAGWGVQVLAKGLLLLSGTTLVQELLLKDLVGMGNTSIVAASVADPYVLLHLSSGNAILLRASQEEGEPSCRILTAPCRTKALSQVWCTLDAGQLRVLPGAAEVMNKGSRITACSLHQDAGGFFDAAAAAAAAAVSSSAGLAAPHLCLLCRSERLDIHLLPSMTTVLSLGSVVDGARLLGSIEPGCARLFACPSACSWRSHSQAG